MIDLLVYLLFTDRVTSAIFGAAVGAIAGAMGVLVAGVLKKKFPKIKTKYAVIVLVVLSFQVSNVLRPWLKNNYPEKIAEHENILLANYLNSTILGRIDDITTLTLVEGSSRGLKYHYKLDVSSQEIDVEHVRVALKEQVSASLCATPETVDMLKTGAILTYDYFDSADQLIVSFDLARDSCKV